MTVLFNNGDLDQMLESRPARAIKRLLTWKAEALLQAAERDVVDVLLEEATVTCPELLRDEAYMLEVGESEVSFADFGREMSRRVPEFTLVVPYTGDREVFLMRARTRQMVRIDLALLSNSELQIAVLGPVSDGAQVRRRFDEKLERIDKHLGWARTDIAQYTERIQREIPGRVAQRRAELLDARNLQASIGFRLVKRSDASTYSVPVTRRRIRPVRPAQTVHQPFKPEPVLADADSKRPLRCCATSATPWNAHLRSRPSWTRNRSATCCW